MMNSTYKLDFGSGSALTASRSRLAGLQIGWQPKESTGSDAMLINDFDFDEMKIQFKNGSSSGDVLFGMCPPLGVSQSLGCIPYLYNFGNARILFSDGIYAEAVTGSAQAVPANLMIVIFYE